MSWCYLSFICRIHYTALPGFCQAVRLHKVLPTFLCNLLILANMARYNPQRASVEKIKKSELHLFALPHALSIAHLLLSVKDLFLLLHQSLPLLLVLQACLPFSLLLLLVQHVLSVRCVSYTLQRLCLHTHIHAVHQSC